MTELPRMPEPYPYLRTGFFGASPLPQGVGEPVDLGTVLSGSTPESQQTTLAKELQRGLDLVTFGAEEGRTISDAALTVLTACEAEGIPTVLQVETADDLISPLAAVVSHAVTEAPAVHTQLLARYGPERTLLLDEPIDPRSTLLADREDRVALEPERIARRRQLLAAYSPKAQADRLLGFLGMPAEPEPLVTALIVSRKAENLHHTLQNLKRQTYPRIEPLLVIDPLYEQAAREATTDWDHPLRIVVANRRSTLADRLNLGVQHAAGELLTVIEETAYHGPYHLTDLVQAVEHSGAHVVGKASWFVLDPETGEPRLRTAKLQRTFGEVPALGSVLMSRETARHLGFTRRAAGINRALAQRVGQAGGTIFSIHAYDTVLLTSGQTVEDLSPRKLGPASLPVRPST